MAGVSESSAGSSLLISDVVPVVGSVFSVDEDCNVVAVVVVGQVDVFPVVDSGEVLVHGLLDVEDISSGATSAAGGDDDVSAILVSHF